MRDLFVLTLVLCFLCPSLQGQKIVTKDSLNGVIFSIHSIRLENEKSPGSRLFLTAIDRSTQKNIAEADISHEYYGGLLHLQPFLTLMKDSDNSILISFQTLFGGDGEHTSNYLILYRFKNNKLMRLLHTKLSFPHFSSSNGRINLISGERLFSLCDVCDGEDASDTEYVFSVPVQIRIQENRIKELCSISSSDENSLLARFIRAKEVHLNEEKKYSEKQYLDYKDFADSVEKQLHILLLKH